MELYPIALAKKQMFPDFYIGIEEIQVPEMYPEYAPGPPENVKYPEFWDTSFRIFKIDLDGEGGPTIEEIDFSEMKEYYKFVEGRRQRIDYWRIMDHLSEEAQKA